MRLVIRSTGCSAGCPGWQIERRWQPDLQMPPQGRASRCWPQHSSSCMDATGEFRLRLVCSQLGCACIAYYPASRESPAIVTLAATSADPPPWRAWRHGRRRRSSIRRQLPTRRDPGATRAVAPVHAAAAGALGSPAADRSCDCYQLPPLQITGGAGFIGSHVATRLVEQYGYRVHRSRGALRPLGQPALHRPYLASGCGQGAPYQSQVVPRHA